VPWPFVSLDLPVLTLITCVNMSLAVLELIARLTLLSLFAAMLRNT
jgi:hypothetical protein